MKILMGVEFCITSENAYEVLLRAMESFLTRPAGAPDIQMKYRFSKVMYKTYRYMFIETALHDIDEFLKNGYGSPDSITWMVFTKGYEDYDVENFKSTAEKLGIHFVGIKDRAEFVNYINYKNIEGCNSDDRESDLITYVSVFSHGQTPRYSGGKETQLSFGYGAEEPDTVNFKTSDITLLDPNAFDHTKTAFYACNVGTDGDSGTNFAQ